MITYKNKFSFFDLANFTDGQWYTKDQEYLRNPESDFEGIVTDSRSDCSNSLFLALNGINFNGHNFISKAIENGACAICAQKGALNADPDHISVPVLMVDDTLKAYQDIARFHRKKLKNLTVLAVTGSSGKTSTKDILKQILSYEYGEEKIFSTLKNTNNFIGVPQNILNITEQHKFAILELGTSNFGEIELLGYISEPDVSIISSIGSAHLESFIDTNGVAREKSSIFKHMSSSRDYNTAVIPLECPGIEIIKNAVKEKNTITFGEDLDADICFTHTESSIMHSSFNLAWKGRNINQNITWGLKGIHQTSNAAAASAAATAIGISPESISKSLAGCDSNGMRMRTTEINGITVINDAYNSNPSSVEAGINWISEIRTSQIGEPQSERLFVILGDMLELGERSSDLHKHILDYTIKKLPNTILLTVGEEFTRQAKLFLATIKQTNNKRRTQNIEDIIPPESPSIISTYNSAEASSLLENILRPGDMVYIKGSRGIKLEKIEEMITTMC